PHAHPRRGHHTTARQRRPRPDLRPHHLHQNPTRPTHPDRIRWRPEPHRLRTRRPHRLHHHRRRPPITTTNDHLARSPRAPGPHRSLPRGSLRLARPTRDRPMARVLAEHRLPLRRTPPTPSTTNSRHKTHTTRRLTAYP